MHCFSQYTRTPMFCCLLGCENRWSLPNTPPGYWALCTLLSYDSAPFLSCGKFPSGVRQGPVIDFHLSGPCPRGPCGAGGLLDLPLVPLAGRGQLVPPPLAGRAVAVFFNSQPLTTKVRVKFIGTKVNVSGFFTKALLRGDFLKFRAWCMNECDVSEIEI